MGLRVIPLTAVGPFSSKDEALAWQQSMQQKIGDCRIIEMETTNNLDKPLVRLFF
ncbi:MAG: hypothetical protein FWF31_12095 [Desulfobulbus sp.]|nr:hypothetical protein [Desulfobulbus sp.]